MNCIPKLFYAVGLVYLCSCRFELLMEQCIAYKINLCLALIKNTIIMCLLQQPIFKVPLSTDTQQVIRKLSQYWCL